MARSLNAINALIHLYRAEMGRMTAYRTRLDTTTNWAITSSGLVGTFALGRDEVSHAAFLFVMLLNLFFLLIEARRFRHYESSRGRVQLLEQHFYPEVLEQEVDPAWVDTLVQMLRCPTAPMSLAAAIGWRVRRNYLWIYGIVLLTWLAKLELSGRPSYDLGGLVERAAVGTLPGWLVWLGVAVFYAGLVLLAIEARRRHPSCEDL